MRLVFAGIPSALSKDLGPLISLSLISLPSEAVATQGVGKLYHTSLQTDLVGRQAGRAIG